MGPVPVTTTRQQSIIPAWHPPYEQYISRRFPLHYDKRAELHDVTCECNKSHPDYNRYWALRQDFESIQTRVGTHIRLRYSEARPKHTVSYNRPRTSPPFFSVTIYEDTGFDVMKIHQETVGLIRKHFPHVDQVVLRYFEDDYPDVDFGLYQ